MAWGNDLVFEAVLAIGGIHQAHLLSASELTTESMMQSKVSGLRSYGETLRLMESHTKKEGYTDMQPAIVAGVLLAYCECIMNHIKPAALHLKAAGQLLRPNQSPDLSPYPAGYEALHATIAKLDFLAQSIVPYSQPSIQKDSLDACNYIDVPDSFSKGSVHRSVSSERVELVQIISRFNQLDNIIWGPWSSKSSRPNSEALSRFQMDLLYWRANSTLTIEGCSESLAILPDCDEPLDDLPIPPEPLFFQSSYAALSAALYNNYMACSFSMLSNGHDLDRNALCAFHYVYQNLRIAEGLAVATLQDSENIDINISLLLYLSFRRCYSREWQTWTIQKLRQCGQQGLLDGSAFANTLENIYHLQLRAELQSNYALKSAYHTTGPLHSRILPLLQPKDERDRWIAYYLRPTASLGHEDVALCVIARATWGQDKRGDMFSVQFDFYDDLAVADVDVASLRDWIQSLEASSLPR
ncbi:fungal specific transcription factor domain-containing protein [Trichoderma breve]|uniref:Fungal specific transcription factor domain-containing protein n=1 Tax=Trichoderma breve TaxID=2034170 RepID=A0A9W9EF05_9HYPO|nr:fungal specific transcription factor domain-containing protein [Trichoderma breve]KAJ4865503.1 fungal specific transcription factor domain-containing protein [Trichoderma breve]